MTLPQALVSHRSPGRIRLRIPERLHDLDFFGHVHKVMRQYPNVTYLKANPITASILVIHKGSEHEIKTNAAHDKLFEIIVPRIEDGERPVTRLADRFFKTTRRIDKMILEMTDHEADLNSLGVVGLLGLSLYQIRRGKFLPAGLPMMAQAIGLMSIASTKKAPVEAIEISLPEEETP